MKIRAIALICVALLLPLAVPASSQGLSNPAALTERAPATYKVRFDTSKGSFVIEVTREWAPNGADMVLPDSTRPNWSRIANF